MTEENSGRKLFNSELKVINLGLDIFFNALQLQNIKGVDVNWRPPPELDQEFKDILDKIL